MKETNDITLHLELYRQMYTIRQVEETLLDLFSKGMLTGTVHTSIGQEACAAGVVNALDRSKDVIWSNHRGHGHYLAYNDDVEGLIAEIMGKASGVCGGIGGSQHIHRDNFYTNGVLGGTVACAAGSAMAEKEKNTDAIVTVFLGDGAMGEGVVYETMNMAALWKLPLLFVLEHNRYAQSTPWQLEHAGDLVDRPAAYGIEVIENKTDNVLQTFEHAQKSVAMVRQAGKPVFLALHTYRFAPHSKGDDFRSTDEIETFRKMDPLIILRDRIGKTHGRQLEELEGKIDRRIATAVQQANDAPNPDAGQYFKEISSC